MARFDLLTEWKIEAPLAQVCDAISDCRQWPRWWKGMEKVEEFEAGDARGIGSLRRFTWKGRVPYRLIFDVRVTRIVPLALLEGRASGDVAGIGRWSFFAARGITVVRYQWSVQTNCSWMNLIAPVARPLFEWNHDQVMRQGAEGLARLLGARLVGFA